MLESPAGIVLQKNLFDLWTLLFELWEQIIKIEKRSQERFSILIICDMPPS